MKLAPIIAAGTCCCALLTVSARAETCDQRYPGSCRLEVSTTIVKTKGDTAAVAPRSSRRVKRAHKPRAKRVRFAALVSVPLPPPSPRRVSAPPGTKATTVVDEAFNSLTSSGSADDALEAALISRRDHMLGFALR